MVDVYTELVKITALTTEKDRELTSCDEILLSINKLAESGVDTTLLADMNELVQSCDINKSITKDVKAEYKKRLEKEIEKQNICLKNGVEYTKEVIKKYLDPLKRVNRDTFKEEISKIENNNFIGSTGILSIIDEKVKPEYETIDNYIKHITSLLSDSNKMVIDADMVNELIFSLKHPKFSKDAFFEKLNLLFDKIMAKDEQVKINTDKKDRYVKIVDTLNHLANIDFEENIDIMNKILDIVKTTNVTEISNNALRNLLSTTRYINLNIVHVKLIRDAMEVVDYGNIFRR